MWTILIFYFYADNLKVSTIVSRTGVFIRFESIHIDVRLNRFSPSESIQKSCDNRFQSSVRIDYGLQLLCYDSFSI